MPVFPSAPRPRRSLPPRLALACAIAALTPLPARAARPPEPITSVALEDLGFRGIPVRYLLQGETVFTLHFVDNAHLLVTFTSRGLLTRLPDADQNDQDQNVTALLLELPSGKILGRALWRERDRGQYLWPIGHGRFILRTRSQLSLLNPLENLAQGKPFEEQPFLELHRRIAFITVSPDADLVSIESTPNPKPKPLVVGPAPTAATAGASASRSSQSAAPTSSSPAPTSVAAPPSAPPVDVQINFYRLFYEKKGESASQAAEAVAERAGETRAQRKADARAEKAEKASEKAAEKAEKTAEAAGASPPPTTDSPSPFDHLIIASAGVVRAPSLIDIPATGDGYLDISRESRGVFLFDFQPHGGGKRIELSPFDSSCNPHPYFIGPADFVALGCRGSDDRQQLAGFNLRGEETWINAFPNHHYFPSLVAAPAAGRFALSRTLLSGTYIDLEFLTAEQILGQEITVMQDWDGRTLFKLNASPFQRAGQNFDLSPDGSALAIIHDEKVQVYRLPPLSRKDQDSLKLASASAPAHTLARIDLGGKPTHRSGPPEEKAADNPAIGAPPTAATEQVQSETQFPADNGNQAANSTPATPSQAAAQTSAPASTQAAAQAATQIPEPNHPQNGDPDPSQRRAPPTLFDQNHPRDSHDPASPPEPPK